MVRGDGDVPGLEDLNFFDKLDYQIDETATEIQGIDVEDGVVAPPPRSSRPNSRRRRTPKGRGGKLQWQLLEKRCDEESFLAELLFWVILGVTMKNY